MTIQVDYEVTSEGAVRHYIIPYARCNPNPPLITHAVRITGVVANAVGQYLMGTVLTVDAVNSVAVVDFTCGMIYRTDVRNCITYAGGGGENAWRAVNIGDPVYFDISAAMPANVYLSTSPLEAVTGFANPLFGWVMPYDESDLVANFPKGIGIAPGSTVDVGVMQRGAGAA